MSGKTIAVAGHAGIGHVHGVAGFVQDDTAGFGVVGAMIADSLQADTRIADARADIAANSVRITTMDGGTYTAYPRRGITPAEACLVPAARMQNALHCQSVAVNCFGRMYGQGALETPVALAAAAANAVVDGFHKRAPTSFVMMEESLPLNAGLMGGITREFADRTVCYLTTVNYTRGGIGPVEDLEGNIALGSKRHLMERLNMLLCPTIIVEGKAYLPSISDQLDQNTFLVRAQRELDNPVVARALVQAAEDLGLPVIFRDDLLPHNPGAMRRDTAALALRLIDCVEQLRQSEFASDKVKVVADLAQLISQDAGAITCLSNPLHDVVRGTGNLPGTSAVLSLLVSREYYDHWKIPLLESEDVALAKQIISRAIDKIARQYEAACSYLHVHHVDIAHLEDALFEKHE
ncbi:MAG: hypothetical protein AMS18_13250 [Gemmatimonas sp. SG8_17]|nr:MAG: hypothetical protein AMS18_13250 [Gemmatimonas sp. SG8_17]